MKVLFNYELFFYNLGFLNLPRNMLQFEVFVLFNHLTGNVIFAKGPRVRTLNEHLIEDVIDNVWFINVPATITDNLKINSAVFNETLSIHGFLNGEHINNLAANYLSKTKTQLVSSTLTFSNDVIFDSNITTPSLNTTGKINDINIEEFMQTVLLNNTDQIFENRVYFDHFVANEIMGHHLVNNLDLESDIMRYDKANIVTGTKVFENLEAENLFVKDHVKINNVSIAQWLKNVLLKDGNHQVTRHYKFNVPPTFENGVSLEGTLNNIPINEDKVMLRNNPQNITGKKTFISNKLEPLTFKSIKIKKGTINGVLFNDLINDQAYLNKDNVFNSPINFHNNITVENMNINKHFNNVNVSELLRNLSSLNQLNNFDENFIHLKHMSQEIQESLQDQAYFIDHYKVILPLLNVNYLASLKSGDGVERMLTFANNSGLLEVITYVWDNDAEAFASKDILTWGLYPNFIEKVSLGTKEYIYLERQMPAPSSEGFTHSAELVHINNNGTIDIKTTQTNGSRFVMSFNLGHDTCLIFIDLNNEQITSICENNEQIYHLATINHKSVDSLTIMNVEESLYLVVTSHVSKAKITVYKWDNFAGEFIKHSIIFEGEPRSISSVKYNGQHYLAVVSGQKQDTMLFGEITIRRYNQSTKNFDRWQILNFNAPLHVEFSVLPSNELILYVLTDNPTEPFTVYMYNGISGFTEYIVGSTLPKTYFMKTFFLNNQVFVATFHGSKINILRGVFKGKKMFD